MRRFAFIAAFAFLMLASPASATVWQTTCSTAIINAGFCPSGTQGTPVVIFGYGIAPADATKLADAICGRDNWQADSGETCAVFADRQVRRYLQELVREWEVRERVEAEREAAEEEVVPPEVDGKSHDEASTRHLPSEESPRVAVKGAPR